MIYEHDMGRGGSWGVASHLLQQRALGHGSVLRWPPLIASPYSNIPSLIRVRQGYQSAASSSLPHRAANHPSVISQ